MSYPLPINLRQQFNRHRSRIDLVYRYLMGQGLLQLLNVLNGFFLLRWLSIDEQAKFSLAMGLQATVGLLGDLGFGGGLLGLISDRTNDKILIGRYIKGLQRVKNRFLTVSMLVGTIAVAAYDQKQTWGLDFWLIYSLILISVYALSVSGYFSAILQMKRNLTNFYHPQLFSAAFRLGVSFLLYSAFQLNAVQVISLTTGAFVFNAWWMRNRALSYYTPAQTSEPLVIREIMRKMGPVIPMVVFYALQGQLTMFLAGFYGKSQTIAELGALGRISQLFALLTPFNTIVLLPFFARSTRNQLLKRFLLVFLSGVCITIPIVLMACFTPYPILWLLGEKYASVRGYLGLYVLGAALWYLSSIVWAINAARNWNHWAMSVFYVVIMCSIQLGAVYGLNLSKVSELIQLNFNLALGTLTAYTATSLVGYIRQVNQATV